MVEKIIALLLVMLLITELTVGLVTINQNNIIISQLLDIQSITWDTLKQLGGK